MIKKSLKNSFRTYLKTTEDPIKKDEYMDINKRYMKFLVKKVIEGHEVTLPSRLGSLCIIGKKQKVRYDSDGNIVGLAPNWPETKKLWERDEKAAKDKKLVYFTNLHSDGIRYHYHWSKSRVIVENKVLYSLIMSRANKKLAAKQIFNKKDYIVKT